jgi:hypothetical protein
MGQRHQIYVKMPETLGIAGFHHQWLYGMTAVESLARVVKFYEAQSKYGPLKKCVGYGLSRQSEVIGAIYSTDVKTGYWHPLYNFLSEIENGETPSEILDPRNGDNNDGITIIDVSQGDLRCCFMNVGHLEGEAGDKVKKLVPISAREYLLAYSPNFFDRQGKIDWREREKPDGDNTKRFVIQDEEFDRVLSALCLIQEKSKLLTLAEVKSMFPAMYKREPKKTATKQKRSKGGAE